MRKAAITLASILTLGIISCASLQKAVERDGIARWTGPTLYIYKDSNNDGTLDRVDVRFVSSFTAGCMGYSRKPLESEINWYKK